MSVGADRPAEADESEQEPARVAPERTKRPLYPRLLGLRNVHPNGWQRALLGEGAIVAAGLLVLADVATAWALLVVPLAVALVVLAAVHVHRRRSAARLPR